MSHVLLVHWNEREGEQRAAKLRAFGHEVRLHWRHEAGGELTRGLMRAPPAAIVIDLARLPSHGRAIATWVRGRKLLRLVPLVFVPGDDEKTARLREALPDATFAPWPRMRALLAKAIASPPREPVVPPGRDYSGTPLHKKLGLAPGGALAAVRAPHDFAATLGTLPAGAVAGRRLAGEANVIVLFCKALAELRADWRDAAECLAERGSLWVAWPKRASGMTTDLDANAVRAFGLAQGLVDTKVCAIDATWSGLRFSRRATRAR